MTCYRCNQATNEQGFMLYDNSIADGHSLRMYLCNTCGTAVWGEIQDHRLQRTMSEYIHEPPHAVAEGWSWRVGNTSGFRRERADAWTDYQTHVEAHKTDYKRY